MSDLARLRWKCRRGLLELDIVLQRFLSSQYAALSPAEQASFEALLASADQDLYELLFRQSGHVDPLLRKLQAC